MATRIRYETHCVTAHNAAGLMSGWQDPPLSAEGAAAARQLGERYRGESIAAVFTSDLLRAVQTAQFAFHDAGVPMVTDSRLRECDFGDLNGAPLAEVEAVRPGHVVEPFPNGQSFTDVLRATAQLLGELSVKYADEQVLIIAHSANKWSLDCLLAGASMAELVSRPFAWRPGWSYTLPSGWSPPPWSDS